jgi:hypothetical protein
VPGTRRTTAQTRRRRKRWEFPTSSRPIANATALNAVVSAFVGVLGNASGMTTLPREASSGHFALFFSCGRPRPAIVAGSGRGCRWAARRAVRTRARHDHFRPILRCASQSERSLSRGGASAHPGRCLWQRPSPNAQRTPSLLRKSVGRGVGEPPSRTNLPERESVTHVSERAPPTSPVYPMCWGRRGATTRAGRAMIEGSQVPGRYSPLETPRSRESRLTPSARRNHPPDRHRSTRGVANHPKTKPCSPNSPKPAIMGNVRISGESNRVQPCVIRHPRAAEAL